MGILGIDEVGRGCWAGPFVVAGVMLATPVDGLRDSKKLSAKQRDRLDVEIQKSASHIALHWTSAEELDDIGLSEAMKRACISIFSEFSKLSPDRMIVDGNINYLPDVQGAEAIIKADGLFDEVMAASIVAKQARDNYMQTTAHQEYPEYDFPSHVGYGTARHMEMLSRHGVSPLHRKSFKPIKVYVSEVGEYRRG